MGWDDYKVNIIERMIDDESRAELAGEVTIKVPKAAKYKKRNKKDADKPDLDVGRLVAVRVEKRGKARFGGADVQGYLQCQILDWHEEDRWWGDHTRMILQVMRSSHESLDKLVGRLVSATWGGHGYWNSDDYSVVSFKRDFVKWR